MKSLWKSKMSGIDECKGRLDAWIQRDLSIFGRIYLKLNTKQDGRDQRTQQCFYLLSVVTLRK